MSKFGSFMSSVGSAANATAKVMVTVAGSIAEQAKRNAIWHSILGAEAKTPQYLTAREVGELRDILDHYHPAR